MYLPNFICRILVRLPKWLSWVVMGVFGSAIAALVLTFIMLSGAQGTWATSFKNPHLAGLAVDVVGLIAGVIGNIATERYLEWESERLPSVKTFFRNHDLTKLVGQSLGMVLRSCSDQLSNRDDALTVLELALTLERSWPEIADSPWAYQWLAQKETIK
ncbi:MAG: hypothetical protein ACU85E_10970 [Gammaproteobacteria bacterium]